MKPNRHMSRILDKMQLINHKFSRYIVAIMACLSSACSPVKVLNSLVPENGYELVSAIAYGADSRQKLDIYLPKNPKTADVQNLDILKKVIIFYYGGNWDSGERADYKFAAEALVSHGYIVVVPDYRVYPEVLFPALMVDPVSAAKWVKTHIKKYNGDANKVFLAGHSAGAHIAVMMAINSEYLAKESLQPIDFAGVIGLAGPYDFLPLTSDRLKTIFGPEDERWKSQPINFVDGKNPPLLLAVGMQDGTVWPRNSINLAIKIQENNGQVEVVKFANYGHVDMVAKLAKPLRGNGELLKPIAAFIDKY
ncbi:MAG TPA: alpha/beta hydrolase [Methylotenera sp.]|nr:alpha/beta hydrolase [Methylotenera sp.]